MAKATKETVEHTEFTIVLSQDEAETLKLITNRIGGHPERSRRRYTDAIGRALRKAGVAGIDTGEISVENRAIYFNDQKE